MIKEYREEAGLTQRQLSDLLEIPLDVIKSWDSGRRKPSAWSEKLIIEKIKLYQKGGVEARLTQEEVSKIMTALVLARIYIEDSIKTAKSQEEKELRESSEKKWKDFQQEIGVKLGYYEKEEKEVSQKETGKDAIMEFMEWVKTTEWFQKNKEC